MSIKCEICSAEGDDDMPAIEFEDDNFLRTHLIDNHSKFVAKALLAPKINDKIHMWLLANIDYSSNPDPDEQNQRDTDENEPESPKEQQDNELNNEALEMLLKEILIPPTGGNNDAQEQPTSSGTAEMNSNADGLDFFAPLKSIFLPAADLEKTDGENVHSRAALVDSKAIRKAHCQICDLDICSTARQRHVYMIHLKKRDLFKCKMCDYTNSNSMWEVQKHCRMQHGADIKPISQEEKHKFEIQMWSQLCFPEWKQKPQKRKYEEVIEDEQMNQAEETGERMEMDEDEASSTKDGGEEESGNAVMDEPEEEPAETNEYNDRLCYLCMEESKYPGRHIAQKHLKQSLYECPICKFGSYESCTVSKHIQKVHPREATKISPISNLEKYADEIRQLQASCFPNRQMKLVRMIKNGGKNRPRERHHCGICSADVAQSDRQRHVFHKHFPQTKMFECPLCPFSSCYDIHRVKWHIKWEHREQAVAAGNAPLEPISHESKYREQIDALNEQCFPGWQRKRHISSQQPEEATHGNMQSGQSLELDGELIGKALRTVAEAMSGGRNGEQPKRERNGGGDQKTATMGERSQKTSNDELMEGANTFEWICQLCLITLKTGSNLLRHVAKEHLGWPLYQCPICQNHGAHSAYEVRSHMMRTHGDTSQEPLSNLEENLEDIQKVWRECFPYKEFKAGRERERSVDETTSSMTTDDNGTRVRCRECGQEMKTEDRQIHVYRHHLREPKLYECPACDFSHYACSSDVRNHIIRAHKNRSDLVPRNNLLRFSKEISEWNERCFPGWINRRLPANLVEDFNNCRVCGMEVRQTSRHISEYHLGIPLHQCPLCEYGAAEARLVQRHMRNNHTANECEGLEPIANVEKRRAEFSELHTRCFPGRPKRLSNITIADESRRAKCRGCSMTISKKRRLLHLLEKHLKKPIYKCKYCLFSATHERSAVEAHQREKHAGKVASVISNLQRHRGEIRRLAVECFHESNLKLED